MAKKTGPGIAVTLSMSDWREVIVDLEIARSQALQKADEYAGYKFRRIRYLCEAEDLNGRIDRIAKQIDAEED